MGGVEIIFVVSGYKIPFIVLRRLVCLRFCDVIKQFTLDIDLQFDVGVKIKYKPHL